MTCNNEFCKENKCCVNCLRYSGKLLDLKIFEDEIQWKIMKDKIDGYEEMLDDFLHKNRKRNIKSFYFRHEFYNVMGFDIAGYCHLCGTKVKVNPRYKKGTKKIRTGWSAFHKYCKAHRGHSYDFYKLIMWEYIRYAIIDRDEGKCQECGKLGFVLNKFPDGSMVRIKSKKSKGFQVHHILPISEGGCNHHDNLQLLCHDCHWNKHRSILKNIPDNMLPDKMQVKKKNKSLFEFGGN